MRCSVVQVTCMPHELSDALASKAFTTFACSNLACVWCKHGEGQGEAHDAAALDRDLVAGTKVLESAHRVYLCKWVCAHVSHSLSLSLSLARVTVYIFISIYESMSLPLPLCLQWCPAFFLSARLRVRKCGSV